MGLRGALASLLFVASVMFASGLAPVTQTGTAPDPAKALLGLLGTGAMYTIALGYPVLRSRWAGWRLVLGLFIAFAGIAPVLLQLESLVYLVVLVPTIPVPVLEAIVVDGFISALLFTPLLVLVFGTVRGRASRTVSAIGLTYPSRNGPGSWC